MDRSTQSGRFPINVGLTVYLEFELPSARGGWPVTYSIPLLQLHLEQWAEFYKVPYHTELTHWSLQVYFEQSRYYSFFALSWPWTSPPWHIHN